MWEGVGNTVNLHLKTQPKNNIDRILAQRILPAKKSDRSGSPNTTLLGVGLSELHFLEEGLRYSWRNTHCSSPSQSVPLERCSRRTKAPIPRMRKRTKVLRRPRFSVNSAAQRSILSDREGLVHEPPKTSALTEDSFCLLPCHDGCCVGNEKEASCE